MMVAKPVYTHLNTPSRNTHKQYIWSVNGKSVVNFEGYESLPVGPVMLKTNCRYAWYRIAAGSYVHTWSRSVWRSKFTAVRTTSSSITTVWNRLVVVKHGPCSCRQQRRSMPWDSNEQSPHLQNFGAQGSDADVDADAIGSATALPTFPFNTSKASGYPLCSSCATLSGLARIYSVRSCKKHRQTGQYMLVVVYANKMLNAIYTDLIFFYYSIGSTLLLQRCR